jgi:hypothetical protein
MSDNSNPFVDWIFQRILSLLYYSEWTIKKKNFRNSKKAEDRNTIGLVDLDEKIIYLDEDKGTVQVLLHELVGHVFFDELLDDEARNQGVKNECMIDRWVEIKILELEYALISVISDHQKDMLQMFIDTAD